MSTRTLSMLSTSPWLRSEVQSTMAISHGEYTLFGGATRASGRPFSKSIETPPVAHSMKEVFYFVADCCSRMNEGVQDQRKKNKK